MSIRGTVSLILNDLNTRLSLSNIAFSAVPLCTHSSLRASPRGCPPGRGCPAVLRPGTCWRGWQRTPSLASGSLSPHHSAKRNSGIRSWRLLVTCALLARSGQLAAGRKRKKITFIVLSFCIRFICNEIAKWTILCCRREIKAEVRKYIQSWNRGMNNI